MFTRRPSFTLSLFRFTVVPVAACVSCGLFVSGAMAGFEFRGPVASPPAPYSAIATPAAPAAEVFPPAVTAAGIPPAAAARVEAVEAVPVLPPSGTLPLDLTGDGTPAPAASGDVVTGFASDLPLAIALQQVVPPGYQFSFDDQNSAGAFVSWQGGKPWRQVLDDMLSGSGLGYELQGNTIAIGPQRKSAAAGYAALSNAGHARVPAARLDGAQEPVTIRRQRPVRHLQTAPAESAGADTAQMPLPVLAPQQNLPAEAPFDMTPVNVAPVPVAAPVDDEVDVQPVAPSRENLFARGPMYAAKTYQARRGQTLREVLQQWSAESGVDLYWSIDFDYRIRDDVAFEGGYDEAVGRLFEKYAAVRPQPYGQLHQPAGQPRVLVVKSHDLVP